MDLVRLDFNLLFEPWKEPLMARLPYEIKDKLRPWGTPYHSEPHQDPDADRWAQSFVTDFFRPDIYHAGMSEDMYLALVAAFAVVAEAKNNENLDLNDDHFLWETEKELPLIDWCCYLPWFPRSTQPCEQDQESSDESETDDTDMESNAEGFDSENADDL